MESLRITAPHHPPSRPRLHRHLSPLLLCLQSHHPPLLSTSGHCPRPRAAVTHQSTPELPGTRGSARSEFETATRDARNCGTAVEQAGSSSARCPRTCGTSSSLPMATRSGPAATAASFGATCPGSTPTPPRALSGPSAGARVLLPHQGGRPRGAQFHVRICRAELQGHECGKIHTSIRL
jgi:hypothetical protein